MRKHLLAISALLTTLFLIGCFEDLTDDLSIEIQATPSKLVEATIGTQTTFTESGSFDLTDDEDLKEYLERLENLKISHLDIVVETAPEVSAEVTSGFASIVLPSGNALSVSLNGFKLEVGNKVTFDQVEELEEIAETLLVDKHFDFELGGEVSEPNITFQLKIIAFATATAQTGGND
ncbi:hypothetical protein V6R21_19610 [Limibacter armeniacum]|uniref:hypothetical protein n=1 Tax=Limibacter armeniacum TaxID=466084 RepID=UPI002FE5412F